ncbi:MAG TPA: ABC transporter ATP-binding protein [Thermomicrobiaceae bacterium]|nr:ABC transporter ATP-binding protein [Thermomicrobiaceae bacterium]
MLRTVDLGAGYRDVQVLWDVNIEVETGEMVAIVGSNGAGKSTLLGALSGLVEIKAGRFELDGRDVTALGSDRLVRLGIVHVPQGRHLFQGLTVRENLLLGAYARQGSDGIQEDLERMLELFPALRRRVSSLAGKLSGGEQQMCAIARGLMGRPRLLMIDELSLGLAPVAVDALMDALAQVHAAGNTILLVEQDVQIALEHAQRGYILDTGRVVLSGPASELLERPEIRTAYLGL